jgi:hypothetical protein
MRKLKATLVACVMASSLFAAAGTAWAQSDAVQRGTSWTDLGGAGMPVDMDPGGISWEVSPSF